MKVIKVLLALCLGVGLLVVSAWALYTASVRAADTATFTVTKFADSADGVCDAVDCSLREAIVAANASPDPATILLAAGTYSLTVTGPGDDWATMGDLDITDDLTLVGSGSVTTIVDAASLSDRAFHVLSGSVVFSGLTIAGGEAPGEGGGVLNAAHLTLVGVTLQGNHTGLSGGSGGGIYNDGTLTMIRVNLEGSYVQFGEGGGIYNASTLTMIDTTIRFNGTGAGFGSGGGVYNAGTLTMIDSTVEHNGAFEADGGGGIFNAGSLVIRGSSIRHNANFGFFGSGGGLSNTGTMTITNSTIADNAAASPGGGIENRNVGLLTGSTVSGNTGAGGGGGIANTGHLTLTNSTVSTNSVTLDEFGMAQGGGGIANSGDLALSFSTVVGNSANVSAAVGGGLLNEGQVTFGSTIVAGNLALGGDPDCSGAGTLTSQGHNLVGSGTGCPSMGTDMAVDPGVVFVTVLGPLQGNGGGTATHALLPGSPAIDAGDDGVCPATDQRGVPRPLDGDGDGTAHCDIGAYEFALRWITYFPAVFRH